ncbi:MAG: 2-hydroxyacyl-CoA dehydratase family protein [Syntrophaceae bacterium]
MIETFRQIASEIQNPYIEAWKAAGKPVIGFPCTFLPEEVIAAAGILPMRFRAVGISSLSIGDTYYGPVVCSFPKCILQLAGEGVYNFLDGVIITPGCDSMRRLDECWRKAGEDIAGITPGFFHYFGVPHKSTDYSLRWFVEELGILIESLEKHFGRAITDEAMRQNIRKYNTSRRLLQRLDQVRAAGTPISGEDALAIVLAGSAMPRDEYNRLLEALVAELEQLPSIQDGRKRLLLVGSLNDDLDFVRVIEECGAVVVGDAMCFGARSYHTLVAEDGDPVEALARHYLSRNLCPRMFGYYKDRLEFILKRVKDTRADGVVLQNIRFCDMHGSENGIFARDLAKAGIPNVRMEREYGPLVESGRIKMRVDAFIERLA